MIGLFASEVIGSGWVFLINAVSYAAVVGGLAAIRVRELHSGQAVGPARTGGQLEGFRYVRTRPDLLAVLGAVPIFGTFGLNFPVLLPLYTTPGLPLRRLGLRRDLRDHGRRLAGRRAARGAAHGRQGALVLGGALGFGVLEVISAGMPDIGPRTPRCSLWSDCPA